MRREYIDIIIVGYGGKKARSFRINLTLLRKVLLSSLVGLVGLVVFSLFTFYQNLSLKREIARLREEGEELRATLEMEREKGAHIESFKEKVEKIEGKLASIDRFLKEKGIVKVPSGVGGPAKTVDVLDMNYLSFLQKEAYTFEEYLRKIPLGPPVWGSLTSHFGYRRDPFTGRVEFHEGVDIRAPWGTPVRATAEGKVVYVGEWGGYGKAVVIDHDHGFRTLYAHMAKTTVQSGELVKSGQVIGYVGSTGRSTGSHVHYEVWRYSKREDPMKYMYAGWWDVR